MTTKTAILYARVSTRQQAQEDRFSLAQQLAALREYTSHEGYEVCEEVQDAGYSGATLERPGLDRVRDLVAAGGASVVLAQDRDRFAREPALLWLLKQELAEHGCALRALNDRGDGSPEGELTDGILDQLAKYERAKIAERTRRGKLQRAREGKVLPGAQTPYGLRFNEDRTNFVVDEGEMATVRRVFRMLGEEGRNISATARELEREGIPAPSGGKDWHPGVVRRIAKSDVYKPHSGDELQALVDSGNLSADVLAALDPERPYGVWWFNRDRVTAASNGARKRTFRKKPRSEWVAVPIPDAGVPREMVDRARAAIRDNVKSSNAGRRLWELSGGVAYCECGARMATHSLRREGGGFRYYYVCSKRRNAKRVCDYSRYHPAEELERCVRRFVLRVLSDPETLREKVEEQLERERATLRDPEGQVRRVLDALSSLDRRRERYQEMFAADAMTLGELKGKLTAMDGERKALKEELGRLESAKGELKRLEELTEEIPEFLADLPHLLEGNTAEVRNYETTGGRRTDDNPLGIYTLTPERIRRRTPEEMEEIERRRERERAERFRWVYGELELKVVVRKDGPLELSGVFGRYGTEPTSTPRSTPTSSAPR